MRLSCQVHSGLNGPFALVGLKSQSTRLDWKLHGIPISVTSPQATRSASAINDWGTDTNDWGTDPATAAKPRPPAATADINATFRMFIICPVFYHNPAPSRNHLNFIHSSPSPGTVPTLPGDSPPHLRGLSPAVRRRFDAALCCDAPASGNAPPPGAVASVIPAHSQDPICHGVYGAQGPKPTPPRFQKQADAEGRRVMPPSAAPRRAHGRP